MVSIEIYLTQDDANDTNGFIFEDSYTLLKRKIQNLLINLFKWSSDNNEL